VSSDEPTQRIRPPQEPVPRMPGPLDLTADEGADTTDVLSLDELFGPAEPEPAPEPPPAEPVTAVQPETTPLPSAPPVAAAPTAAAAVPAPPTAPVAPAAPAAPVPPAVPAAADAPTWTAMPMVSVRPEPVAATDGAPVAPVGAPARPPRRPLVSDRLRADARAAWEGTLRHTREWLWVQDNALMVATTLVAVLLIVIVATLAS